MPVREPLAVLAGHLADNLRAIRQKRGLTQAQLAKLCEVPRSTIANIETGEGNPTLAVLTRLASSLQLSIEELLSAPKSDCRVFPSSALHKIVRGRGAKATLQSLLPQPTPGMEIDRLELEPGASFAGSPHRAGTSEFLACERGQLTLWVGGEKFSLSAGDVASFSGDQAHSYHNQGRSLAVGFSVVALSPLSRSA